MFIITYYCIHNNQTTSYLQKIDWKLYFKMIFEVVDISLPDAEFVVLYAPKYMAKLGDLLETTPNRLRNL